MEKIFLYIVSFLGGILFWSLRSLLIEKTMKRRASDQYVSLGELDLHCRRRHDIERDFRSLEVSHLKEVFEKDLAANTSRLEKVEDAISRLSNTLGNVDKKMIKLLET